MLMNNTKAINRQTRCHTTRFCFPYLR